MTALLAQLTQIKTDFIWLPTLSAGRSSLFVLQERQISLDVPWTIRDRTILSMIKGWNLPAAISKTPDQLRWAKVYAKLNYCKAYDLSRFKEGDKWETVVKPVGGYLYTWPCSLTWLMHPHISSSGQTVSSVIFWTQCWWFAWTISKRSLQTSLSMVVTFGKLCKGGRSSGYV